MIILVVPAMGQECQPPLVSPLVDASCEETVQVYFDQACEAGVPSSTQELSSEMQSINDDFLAISEVSSLEEARNFNGSTQDDLALSELEYEICTTGPNLPVPDSQLSPQDICLQTWKVDRVGNLFERIFSTPEYRQSLASINTKFEQYGNSMREALSNPWYFELSPNAESNLSQMNRILRRLPGTLMSERSSEKVMQSLSETMDNGLAVHGLDLNIGAGVQISPTKGISVLGIANIILDQTTSMFVNQNMVLANMEPANDFFVDWVMAHEMAHHYTAHVDRIGTMNLSRDSREDIKKRHRACLYTEGDSKRKIGEDLADLIANSLVEQTHENVTLEEFQAMAYQFCQSGFQESHRGHSSGIDRLQNLVKYNSSLQELLGCREERISCTIKTTPLTGDEETY